MLRYICTGQVSCGQLPLNPPGPEGSKGRRLMRRDRNRLPFFRAQWLRTNPVLRKGMWGIDWQVRH
jgi:hypothetical protein